MTDELRLLTTRFSFRTLLLFCLLWEILGAVYLFTLSCASKERVRTLVLSVGLYLLGVVGSLGLGVAVLFSIIY